MLDTDALAIVVVVQIRKLAKDISSFGLFYEHKHLPLLQFMVLHHQEDKDSYDPVHLETYSSLKQNGT